MPRAAKCPARPVSPGSSQPSPVGTGTLHKIPSATFWRAPAASGAARRTRRTVPSPKPSLRAICLGLRPWLRSSTTPCRSKILLGLPTGRFFPDRLGFPFPPSRRGNPGGSASIRVSLANFSPSADWWFPALRAQAQHHGPCQNRGGWLRSRIRVRTVLEAVIVG